MENKLLDDNFKNQVLDSCMKLYHLQSDNKKFDNSDQNKQNKKEKTGEVLTPLHVVYDMLSKETTISYYMEMGIIKLMIIPDIESINYGRDVGYDIIEHTPPKDIEQVSGTKIRELKHFADDFHEGK